MHRPDSRSQKYRKIEKSQYLLKFFQIIYIIIKENKIRNKKSKK